MLEECVGGELDSVHLKGAGSFLLLFYFSFFKIFGAFGDQGKHPTSRGI